MDNTTQKHTREFKTKAVLLSFEKKSIAKVADHLNISRQSLFLWRNDYIKYGTGSFPGYGNLRQSTEQKKIKELQKELKKITLESEIIKSAGDYRNKGKLFTFNFIAANEKKYSITLMCKILGENRGSYRTWKNEIVSERKLLKIAIKEKIMGIFQASQQRYGCRRIAAELRKSGHNLSHTTVLKHMRELNINVSIKKISHDTPA